MTAITAENLKQVPLPKNTVIVAREDGRLYLADFTEFPNLDDAGAVDWDLSISKLLLSKIQMTRTRLGTLEEIEIENVVRTGQIPVGANTDLKVTVYGSLDGKTDTLQTDPVLVEDGDGYLKATCRITAKNFGIMLRGVYNVNTIQVTMHQNGRR